MNQRTCSVPECERPRLSRGYCNMHYLRLRRNGEPGDVQPKPGGPKAKGNADCAVVGCMLAARVRGWCGSHYSQWQRRGAVTPILAAETCATCGEALRSVFRSRRFCSDSCQQIMAKRGPRPLSVECNLCGSVTDLTVRRKSGRLQQSNIVLCPPCRRRHGRKHRASVPHLARRDGTDCKLCGSGIDMTLRWPDAESASIDHIVPYSLGGTHDLENLQLAHLVCNTRKGNRTTT